MTSSHLPTIPGHIALWSFGQALPIVFRSPSLRTKQEWILSHEATYVGGICASRGALRGIFDLRKDVPVDFDASMCVDCIMPHVRDKTVPLPLCRDVGSMRRRYGDVHCPRLTRLLPAGRDGSTSAGQSAQLSQSGELRSGARSSTLRRCRRILGVVDHDLAVAARPSRGSFERLQRERDQDQWEQDQRDGNDHAERWAGCVHGASAGVSAFIPLSLR